MKIPEDLKKWLNDLEALLSAWKRLRAKLKLLLGELTGLTGTAES